MFSLAITLLLVSVIALVLRKHARRSSTRNRSIAIVVLGDIARSPRMMRHALSFADQQWYVSVFAYGGWPFIHLVFEVIQIIIICLLVPPGLGSKPPTNFLQHPKIQLVNLPEFPDWISSILPRILFVLVIGPLKALYLSASLIWTLLFKATSSSHIMVQVSNDANFFDVHLVFRFERAVKKRTQSIVPLSHVTESTCHSHTPDGPAC
jgi:hypothetical protein